MLPTCPKCQSSRYVNHRGKNKYSCWLCQYLFEGLESMPISNRSEQRALKESSARLAPIFTQLRDEVFFGDDSFLFFGPAVRESLMGGQFDEIDLFIGGNTVSKAFTASFAYYLISHVKLITDEEEKTDKLGAFQLKTQFGTEYKINVWFHRPGVIWSCDDVTFSLPNNKPQHSGSINIPTFTDVSLQILNYDSITAENVIEHLKIGADLTTRYGWQMSTETLQKLNGIIESSKPLDMVYETITGFRSFNIDPNGKLQGFHSTIWDTAELEVDCPEFRVHIKESEETSGGSPITATGEYGHGCGIYIYKSVMECLMNYAGQAIAVVVANGGDVWEGERGYRVEKARIEKLWVFRDSKFKLAPNYQVNGGVVVDCTRDEFLREVFSSGMKIDSERALQ